VDADPHSETVTVPMGRVMTERWNRFWFEEIPVEIYSILRMLFGVLGLLSVIGLLDLPLFWSCDGLVASRGSSLCQSWGNLYPYSILAGSLISFAAMAVGFYTRAAVICAFASVSLIARWNSLPLSSAHQVLRAFLFCLIWADCGKKWSFDAWLNRPSENDESNRGPIWPLRLFQIQVAAVYLITALWKINSVLWRDGSALHYIFQYPEFRRFPQLASPSLDSWTTVATYATLAWELGFAFLVLHPRTRRWALVLGIVSHLGMWATLELGPFSWIMVASYVAFVDPDWFHRRLEAGRPALRSLIAVRAGR
jgi:hypothetical protein